MIELGNNNYELKENYKDGFEIQALYDNGLTGGYMTWNSGSNLVKYKEISYSFKKVYE